MTGQTRSPYLLIAILLLVAGCLLQAVAGYTHHDLSGHATGTDDAFISYRYACNFADGQGLTFNPGERVEGYSNFLYVLLMSLGCWIAESWVFQLSVIFNIGASIAALLVFHRLVRVKLGEERAIAGALLFALSPTIWCWAASGLETSLITLLQISILAVVERSDAESAPIPAALLAWLSVGMVLSRVDGFLIPALVIAYLIVTQRPRPALVCLAAVTAALAAHLTFRYGYYGDLLPNTFYVKVSGPLPQRVWRAAGQLLNLAMYQGLGVYLLAMAAAVLTRLPWPIRDLRAAALQIGFARLFAICWLAYFVFIGGDVYKERFLLIFYPLGAYLLLDLTTSLSVRAVRAVVALALVLQLSILATDVRFGFSADRYDRWVTLGEFLGEQRPGKTIAVDAAGKVPYFSGLEAIDMFGLNDRTISRLEPPQKEGIFNPGHGKFDADYVLSRNPDLIVGWIQPELHVTGGMEREKYEPAGYRVRFLLNSGRDSRTENILDVRGMSEDEIIQLVRDDYNYAVLEK